MKKILFVSHDATLSGAPLVLFEILNRLQNTNKFYIKVLFLQGGEKLKDFELLFDTEVLERTENTVFKKIKRKIFSDNNELIKKLNKEKFDLLYLNSIASFVFFQDLEYLKAGKTILHMHESGNFPYYSHEIFKKVVKRADKIICVSNLVKSYLVSSLEVNLDKVSVIYPYYFDKKLINHDGKNKEAKETFIVGGCGNYSLTKGLDIFVLVASNFFKIYGKQCPVKFMWLGDSGYKEATYLINRDIGRLGLEEKISILPKTEIPSEVFKKFDIFFLSSREEAFGLAAFENGILGNPVICFENSSGVSELIESKKTILPHLDIEAVTKLIWDMFDDRKLLEDESMEIQKTFVKVLKNDDLKNIGELISELIN